MRTRLGVGVTGLVVAALSLGLPASAAVERGSSSRVAAATVRVAPAARGPLQTALYDGSFNSADADLAFRRLRSAGVSIARIVITWSAVAPRAPADPTNPAAPEYSWAAFDRQLTLARSRGLTPLVTIFTAPRWAQASFPGADIHASAVRRGIVAPRPADLAAFATAAARRYSGTFNGLPRVRYWQLWNEQNHGFWLQPQFIDGRPVSPDVYRSMLNAFSGAVRGVRGDNVVVAGGLAPFSSGPREDADPTDLGPLRFMRLLLCLSPNLTRACADRTSLDVWAMHPYTSGSPLRKAARPDDVSLGNLPEMRRTLVAAARAGTIASSRTVQFWVTEFSWDTSPPDPQGLPLGLHARWTAEALYRMWRAGVSVVTWFSLRDDPFTPTSYFQAGLYFRGKTMQRDRAKPALHAFRFPFVAFRERGRVTVWGRTPRSTRGSVRIEQRVKGRWVRLRVVRANRHGIFSARVRARAPRGPLRATYRGSSSRPFSLVRPRERFVRPFGTYP